MASPVHAPKIYGWPGSALDGRRFSRISGLFQHLEAAVLGSEKKDESHLRFKRALLNLVEGLKGSDEARRQWNETLEIWQINSGGI
jgi:hypothetical protein